MKKKKLKHQKKAVPNSTYNYRDHYEMVFDYYPGTLRQRVSLRLKSDPGTFQTILDSLEPSKLKAMLKLKKD